MLFRSAEQHLFQLAEQGRPEGGFKAFRDTLTKTIEAIESAYKSDARLIGVSTGLIDLDKMLGGLHRSDLIVRADAPFRTLEDTFGHRAAWTVRHSHSGFNAFRHHLLQYRSALRTRLYREMVPDLVTARAILDGVRDGRFDVGPLDAYWHWLIARHAPELTSGIRVLESTAVAPMPAFVAAAGAPEDAVLRLKSAFAAASRQPWFARYQADLGLNGFAPVSQVDFAVTLERDAAAHAADYSTPA